MLADPIRLNSRLGTYTNFFNLLGLSGIAVPAGFRADGMPFGVTLAATGFCDSALEPIAERLQYAAAGRMGRPRRARLPTPASPEAPDFAPRLNLDGSGGPRPGMALYRWLLARAATRSGDAGQ